MRRGRDVSCEKNRDLVLKSCSPIQKTSYPGGLGLSHGLGHFWRALSFGWEAAVNTPPPTPPLIGAGGSAADPLGRMAGPLGRMVRSLVAVCVEMRQIRKSPHISRLNRKRPRTSRTSYTCLGVRSAGSAGSFFVSLLYLILPFSLIYSLFVEAARRGW